LRVVDQRGVRLTFVRATVRHFAKVLSAMPLYLGFIVIAFNERKLGLHDIVASTYVVWPPERGRRSEPGDPWDSSASTDGTPRDEG
jgi:uncharacterized RDD family membrane protein YckC